MRCSPHIATEDLEGLKVSHDFDDMAEGEARVLTLKDSRILDNDGERWD
jgi:U4/U6.U5 tri-snRNP-associated protein 1